MIKLPIPPINIQWSVHYWVLTETVSGCCRSTVSQHMCFMCLHPAEPSQVAQRSATCNVALHIEACYLSNKIINVALQPGNAQRTTFPVSHLRLKTLLCSELEPFSNPSSVLAVTTCSTIWEHATWLVWHWMVSDHQKWHHHNALQRTTWPVKQNIFWTFNW